MLDLDTWQEVLDTVRSNKLRSFLTGFSVAWGIFMLVVLLGSGEGLSHGVEYQFRDDAINSLWIYTGQTSVPYNGLGPGRNVQLTNEDHDEIAGSVPGAEHVTSRFYIRGAVNVSYRQHTGSWDVRAVHPDHRYLERTLVTLGRFLDELDVRQHRKVACIGEPVRRALLGAEPPLGRSLLINGVAFQIVGVFEDEGGEGEMQKIYIPISTAQRAFNGANRVNQIMLTTGEASVPDSQAMAATITRKLARRHEFAPADDRALTVRNNNEQYQRISNVLGGIRLFVWIVGAGTIVAGVVGVSNIMLITVRERTREIGIRKALGATPASVIGLVLTEAVSITAFAGYVGLVLGVVTLELASGGLRSDFFRDPGIDLRIALWATLLLVAAGTLAGLVPALKAATIRPIVALRDE